MILSPVALLAPLLAALALNLVLTPLILAVSRKRRWFDVPNHRTIHRVPTPRLGGVGIVLSFGLVLLAEILLEPWLGFPQPLVNQPQNVVLLALGLAATHGVGLLDDFMEFRAVYKGGLQLVGALLALGSGVEITHLTVPFTSWVIPLGPFGPLLTLVWILALTNAMNLIDGMDGLAGAIGAMAMVFIGTWALMSGHPLQALACAAALGAVGAFLVFNLPPARIFMGDSGSLSLGYLIAILTLWGGESSLFHQFWLMPFTALLIPLGDTVSAILRRLLSLRPIWAPDREHTHHKLMALGFSSQAILGMLFGTMALTSTPALLASLWPDAGPWLAVVCLVAVALVVAGFTVLHLVYRRRYPRTMATPGGL